MAIRTGTNTACPPLTNNPTLHEGMVSVPVLYGFGYLSDGFVVHARYTGNLINNITI